MLIPFLCIYPRQMHPILQWSNCRCTNSIATFFWTHACACLKPAGFVPGSPLHLALFLGPLRPRKSAYGEPVSSIMTRWFTSELMGGCPLFALLQQRKWAGFAEFNLNPFALYVSHTSNTQDFAPCLHHAIVIGNKIRLFGIYILLNIFYISCVILRCIIKKPNQIHSSSIKHISWHNKFTVTEK